MIRLVSKVTLPPATMRIETDPAEIAKAQAQRAQFDANARWLQAHAREIYSQNRGRFFCIAGQELFTADTGEAAIAAARSRHPDDHGFFFGSFLSKSRFESDADPRRVVRLR